MFIYLMRMSGFFGYPFCELFVNKSDNLFLIACICYTYAL